MPEPCCWKNETYWKTAFILTIGGFIAVLLMGFFASREAQRPQTYRLEIVYPAPLPALSTGKRSQPGKLSPETEHWQTVRAVLEGKTNLNIQRGPDNPLYRWEQQRLLEEQELGK